MIHYALGLGIVALTLMSCATHYPYAVSVECAGTLPSGPSVATNAGGDRITGGYCEGERCGPFDIYVRTDVHIARIPYLAGRVQGPIELWYQPQNARDYDSRYKASIQYSRDVRDGLSEYWCPNGNKRAEVMYSNGEVSSAKGWDCYDAPYSAYESDQLADTLRGYDETYFEVLFETLTESDPSC